jgi:UDP-2,3-diacylglucosamine hydrolase
VPVYFASDMHLRLDRPDRGRRLARWVDGLNPDDSLYLVGDICDFWFASRQRRGDPLACEGLRALAGFRSRGGALTVLLGNHDLWLGPFYQEALGATLAAEPLLVEAHGKRLYLVHGHRTGGRQPWKTVMESRAFLEAFELLPVPLAASLNRLLDGSNERGRERDEARLLSIFRQHLANAAPPVDIAVFGHIHTPQDDTSSHPRLVVLGGWHTGSCYLRLDDSGATHVVEPATRAVPA